MTVEEQTAAGRGPRPPRRTRQDAACALIKIAGALLLLVSLELPMSSCSHYEDAQGKHVKVATGAPLPVGIRQVVAYKYAFDSFDPAESSSWLTLLAFTWPAVMAGLLYFANKGRTLAILRLLEVALLAYSIWLVDLLSTLFADRREVGAYVAFAGLGVYALAALWQDAAAFRRWRRARKGGEPRFPPGAPAPG